MNSSVIKQIPIYHCGRLHALFGEALEKDFAYFSPNYRQGVHNANSRAKLQLACVHPKRLLLGLYNKGELVGYSISSIQSSGHSFLFWLYVAPSMRGKRHGVELLNETEIQLRKRNVDTIELITHNQKPFYERHGYEMSKIMREIAAGVDMYIMTKGVA